MYTEAQQLQDLFAQKKQTEEELKKYKKQSSEMEKKEKLAGSVTDAWEIKTFYDFWQAGQKDTERIRKELKIQMEKLPGLAEEEKRALEEEQKHQKELEAAQGEYTRTVEKAEKALKLFGQIREAKKKADAGKEILDRAKLKEEADRELLRIWKKGKRLYVTDQSSLRMQEKLAVCQSQVKEINGMTEDLKGLSGIYKEQKAYEKKIEELKEKYKEARALYEKNHGEYEKMRRDFLDAQAGFLAAELMEGMPCPVCGSTEHPRPCVIKEVHSELSQERMELLEKKQIISAQNRKNFPQR